MKKSEYKENLKEWNKMSAEEKVKYNGFKHFIGETDLNEKRRLYANG